MYEEDNKQLLLKFFIEAYYTGRLEARTPAIFIYVQNYLFCRVKQSVVVTQI